MGRGLVLLNVFYFPFPNLDIIGGEKTHVYSSGNLGGNEWQETEGARFLNCMCQKVGEDNWDKVLDWDGTVRGEDVLHPVAVIATNAAAYALVSETTVETVSVNAKTCLDRFWNTPLRTGERRYYDNCLYLFAFMLLSGRYRRW